MPLLIQLRSAGITRSSGPPRKKGETRGDTVGDLLLSTVTVTL